jgi:predicted O-linked N-acetylglucosamine transferase (SPINDLY family)
LSFDRQQQLREAIQLHQAGRLAEAEPLYLQVLAFEPANFTATHFLGVIRYQQERYGEAITLIGAALRMNPASAGALTNYGLALKADGRLAEALASFDKSIASKPDDPESHNNRGQVLLAMGRLPQALAGFDRAIALRRDHAEAWNYRGIVLAEMKRFDEALIAFDAAIAVQPHFALALNNRGNALLALGRGEEALAAYDSALAVEPDYADAVYNRGQPLMDAMRFEEALASYTRAIALRPDFAKALNGKGIAQQKLGRVAEALASYNAALAITPDPETLNNCGGLLLATKRFEEARNRFNSALEIAPGDDHAFGGLAAAALNLCDWPLVAELAPQVRSRTEEGRPCVDPLIAMGYHDDSALQRQASENYQRDRMPQAPRPLPARALSSGGRIRIAYLSADFRTHPVASLIAGLFEHHDRSRFEVSAISLGPNDRSAMRARLEAGFEHFHDVQSLADQDVAKLLTKIDTDIAIDLNGHTQGARLGILAYRPAPVQVSYLGYPGTTGAKFIDYLIADKVVLPPEQQRFFSEKIVYLPHSYQVNDSNRKIAAVPDRRAAGLPDGSFVFCSFNNNWKITAPIFAIWMRLLSAVPGSVLWLIEDNVGASGNLGRAAAAHGVDPDRLVFAPRVREAEHLARQQLADLFLDTLPYNAHTTASDALWSGLPLLTCRGTSFPARVGASLLQTIGLPELVTESLEEYESAALKLAKDPVLLKTLRDKLAGNAMKAPLFDTDRSCCDLESAYRAMWETAKCGAPPRSFAVEPG